MKRKLSLVAGLAAALSVSVVSAGTSLLRDGDRLVFCGDSITCGSWTAPNGCHHLVTNAIARAGGVKGVTVTGLGFCGNTVASWIARERNTRGPNAKTELSNRHGERCLPQDTKATLDGKVDVVVLLLGMNDILMPAVGATEKARTDWARDYALLASNLWTRTRARELVLGTFTPLTADPNGPKNLAREDMNRHIRRIAKELGARVWEAGPAAELAIAETRRCDPEFREASDFVHPRDLGHLAMASAFCRAVGEESAALDLDARRQKALAERFPLKPSVSYRLYPRSLATPDAAELAYDLVWNARGFKSPAVTFEAPAGWTCAPAKTGGTEGTVHVVGRPDRWRNVVRIRAKEGAADVAVEVPFAAPWCVSEPFDFEAAWQGWTWRTNAVSPVAAQDARWSRLVAGTWDYLGRCSSGSVDLYQALFGGLRDSVYVRRRIVSEKVRTVGFAIGSEAFSATQGFVVTLNGAEVWRGTLTRGQTRLAPGAKMTLAAGANELVIRVDHNQWQRHFSFDLEPEKGDSLDNLRYDWRTTPPPLPTGGICAHRGDRAEYPENTVPAFRAAVEKGAAMVEFDVHRCKTGELVVMHDDTIDRTTTGRGRWRDLTFAELRAVDAGVRRGERFRGVRVPTFDEAIDCFPTDKVWLNVHCDDSVTDEVARKIRAKGRLHQAFVAAGLPGVRRARAAVPEIKVCLFSLPNKTWSHVWTDEERRASLAAVMSENAEFTQPNNADFTQDELYAYHARGGKVNYFWCNQPSRLPALLARGIDFPLTDCLESMVRAYNDCLKRPWAPAEPELPFQYLGDGDIRYNALVEPDWAHARRYRKFGGIASVAVSPKNGRLWRTWYAGPTDGEDSNNYVVLATSADGGRTWKEVLVFDPDGVGPKRAFDPQVWVDPKGRLQWFWCERKVLKRDGENERWAEPHFAQTERLMAVTLDAENEPTAPYPAPRQLAPCGVMMEKPLVTRGGRWLYPLAVWGDDFSARVYESTDGGETLEVVGAATVPLKHRQYEEHSLVELGDGTIRMYMRVKGNAGWNAWQADSRDGGRTWSAPKACPFPHTNSRLFVRRLKSGALLLVKNGPIDRDTGKADYQGRVDMTAFVSDDDGATWTGGLLLHRGPCAYPDGDQAPDGTIFVVCDDDRFDKQSVFLSRFTEADVRKGGELK